MASRCRERIAIENGSARAAPQMLMWVRARPGCRASSDSAVMPPIELPITQASRGMSSARTTCAAASAPSSIDSSGNDRRYGVPVAGSIDAGPVEPLQLPSELTQTTNQRSVSIGLPGPSIGSHQPGVASSSWLAACASGDRPVTMRMALPPSASSLPQVSKAMRAPCRAPPRFIGNGEGRSVKRVPGGMNSVMWSSAL